MSPVRHRCSPSGVAVGVLVAGTAVTGCVVLIPQVRFGYRSADGHIAVETAAVVIALLVAILALGRFRRNAELADLLLTATFTLLALVNLVFSAVPAVVWDMPNDAATWGAVGGRAVGAGVLASAAVVPACRVPPGRGVVLLLACTGGGLLAAGALAAAAGSLPEPMDPELSPTVGMPGLDGDPLLVGAQLLAALFYGVAALGYLRRTRVAADPLYAGLGVGSVLAGCSATNYALFPSLFSDWIYLGDLFRLVSYLVFLVAAFREIGSYWQGQSRLAVLEERQRLARDLHDGLAQELAFIVRNVSRLPEGNGAADRIQAAARRALAESRQAIHALSATGRSLDEAIADAAARSAGRTSIVVDLDLDPTAAVGPRQQEALTRIAAEAVANAGQHAGTEEVRVLLDAGPPVRLQIRDQGRGFDLVGDDGPPRGFGMRSMAARARDVGADLQIDSAPGRGTTVEVQL
jgi:signal transduction histidine kinase